MISPKIFALSLLFVSPLALARVQCTADMEINHLAQNRSISTQVTLDVNESVEVYNNDDTCITAKLLTEDETQANVQYTVSVKNAEGVYEVATTPEVCAIYGDTTAVSIGNTDGDSFTMTLKANKA